MPTTGTDHCQLPFTLDGVKYTRCKPPSFLDRFSSPECPTRLKAHSRDIPDPGSWQSCHSNCVVSLRLCLIPLSLHCKWTLLLLYTTKIDHIWKATQLDKNLVKVGYFLLNSVEVCHFCCVVTFLPLFLPVMKQPEPCFIK